MCSEEDEKVISVDVKQGGKYVVSFDPLDGSSNIDANISIGSIFGVWKRISETDEEGNEEDVLQAGTEMIAAGYCCYGSATQLVLCTKDEPVHAYTLDPSLGEFILTHPEIRIP